MKLLIKMLVMTDHNQYVRLSSFFTWKFISLLLILTLYIFLFLNLMLFFEPILIW